VCSPFYLFSDCFCELCLTVAREILSSMGVRKVGNCNGEVVILDGFKRSEGVFGCIGDCQLASSSDLCLARVIER